MSKHDGHDVTIVDFLGWAGADRAAGSLTSPRNVADIPMPAPTPLMVIDPVKVAEMNGFLDADGAPTMPFALLTRAQRVAILREFQALAVKRGEGYWADGRRVWEPEEARARLNELFHYITAYAPGDAS